MWGIFEQCHHKPSSRQISNTYVSRLARGHTLRTHVYHYRTRFKRPVLLGAQALRSEEQREVFVSHRELVETKLHIYWSLTTRITQTLHKITTPLVEHEDFTSYTPDPPTPQLWNTHTFPKQRQTSMSIILQHKRHHGVRSIGYQRVRGNENKSHSIKAQCNLQSKSLHVPPMSSVEWVRFRWMRAFEPSTAEENVNLWT